MKIVSINASTGTDYSNGRKVIRFSVTYNDGLIIVYNYDEAKESLVYFAAVSIGLDSYYLKKYRLPGPSNMLKRLTVAEERIKKNRKRYKVFKV